MRPLITGPLRQQIYLETPTVSRTASGQNNPVWSVFAQSWAKIATLSGRNLAVAQANTITATSTHLVTMRWIDGITNIMRIRFGDFNFSTLTNAQLLTLTDDELLALSLTGSDAPRVFAIDAVDNTEERNIQLEITCTEIKA